MVKIMIVVLIVVAVVVDGVDVVKCVRVMRHCIEGVERVDVLKGFDDHYEYWK